MKVMTPEMPAVPLTVEGASVLHQMMRFRRPAGARFPLKAAANPGRGHARADSLERFDGGRQSAVYSLLATRATSSS